MTKILETTDEALLLEIKAIQDEEGGATKNGQPKIGCKKINGKFIPLDQLPGYTPDKWRGTKSIHEIESDEVDPTIKKLKLTDDMVKKIDEAKTKKAKDRDEKEAKLALATVKDKVEDSKEIKGEFSVVE